VDTSFLLYPDELRDEETNILVASLLCMVDDNFGEFLPTTPKKIKLINTPFHAMNIKMDS
jgi:hypothetical protein